MKAKNRWQRTKSKKRRKLVRAPRSSLLLSGSDFCSSDLAILLGKWESRDGRVKKTEGGRRESDIGSA